MTKSTLFGDPTRTEIIVLPTRTPAGTTQVWCGNGSSAARMCVNRHRLPRHHNTSSPPRRVDPRLDQTGQGCIRPIPGTRQAAMLHGVEMHVVHMHIIIPLVSKQMLPIPSLPNATPTPNHRAAFFNSTGFGEVHFDQLPACCNEL